MPVPRAHQVLTHTHTHTIRAVCTMYSPSQASVVRYFNGHSEAVMSVQWSPHFDNFFVSASNDNTVVLWDINGGAGVGAHDGGAARPGESACCWLLWS